MKDSELHSIVELRPSSALFYMIIVGCLVHGMPYNYDRILQDDGPHGWKWVLVESEEGGRMEAANAAAAFSAGARLFNQRAAAAAGQARTPRVLI